MEDDIHAGTAAILGLILTGSPVGRGQEVHSELRRADGTAARHFDREPQPNDRLIT
jgi:hypothetical protein